MAAAQSVMRGLFSQIKAGFNGFYWVSAKDFLKITCQSNTVGGTETSVFFVMEFLFFNSSYSLVSAI